MDTYDPNVSPLLRKPLRTLDEALAELRPGFPRTDDAAIDALIAEAEILRVRAKALAGRVGYEARKEIRAFADLLEDNVGDTLRAYKVRMAEEADERAPMSRPGCLVVEVE